MKIIIDTNTDGEIQQQVYEFEKLSDNKITFKDDNNVYEMEYYDNTLNYISSGYSTIKINFEGGKTYHSNYELLGRKLPLKVTTHSYNNLLKTHNRIELYYNLEIDGYISKIKKVITFVFD